MELSINHHIKKWAALFASQLLIYIYIYIYYKMCKGVTCPLTRDDIQCSEYLQYTTLPSEHVDLSPVISTYQSISSKFIKFLYCLENEQRLYFYLPTFSNAFSNRFSITFSISFKYYLTTTHLPTFFYSTLDYYNRKKKHLKNEQQPIRLDELLFMSKKKFQLQRIY